MRRKKRGIILWYRKVYRIPLRKLHQKLLPKAIFLLLLGIICLAGICIDTAKGQESGSLPLKDEALSLEECIRFALRNSFEVKLAKLDFLIAQTDRGIAEAIYDTVLSVDVSYEKDKRQPLSVFGADDAQTNIYSVEATKTLPSGTELTFSLSDERTWNNSRYVSNNPAHTAEATLEARQPLGKNIFGFIDRRDITVTSLAIQNADLDTKERVEALLAEVEAAYWKWAFAKRNLEIYRQILEKAKDLNQANAQNFDLGRIERGDFLASQANVLLREKDVHLAENKYRQAEGKIKLLMNVNADRRIHPQQTLEYRKIEVDLEDCLNKAFQKRRDYQKIKRQLEIDKITLETKENARWPEIDLVASFAANGIDSEFGRAINNITTDNNADYYTGLEISLPIENNLARSEFEKAAHNKEKALIMLKNIERSMVTEIGNAFYNYTTYEANLSKIIEATGLQQEKLKEEEKRFKQGRSNTKRLIDYQQDYLSAQLEAAKGLVNLEVARIDLEKTLNIILEKYQGIL